MNLSSTDRQTDRQVSTKHSIQTKQIWNFSQVLFVPELLNCTYTYMLQYRRIFHFIKKFTSLWLFMIHFKHKTSSSFPFCVEALQAENNFLSMKYEIRLCMYALNYCSGLCLECYLSFLSTSIYTRHDLENASRIGEFWSLQIVFVL